MVFSYLYDVSRKFMSHDGGMVRHILVDAFVAFPEDGAFISGHADTVGYDLDKDLVVCDFRKLKFIQSQVICSVQSYSFCFHNKSSFLYSIGLYLFLQQLISSSETVR